MITVSIDAGKFFFSGFLNLFEKESKTLDETTLSISDLKYLLSAYNADRLNISNEDVTIIQNRLQGLINPSSGVDPSVLEQKEDKSNKVSTISEGIDIAYYPTAEAVVSYISTNFVQKTTLTSYALKTDLSAYATTAVVANKVDKISGKGLSTNDFTAAYKTQLDGINTTIDTKVSTAVSNIVGGAPSTFDTLKEIADWIAGDGVNATELTAALADRVTNTAFVAFQNKINSDVLIVTDNLHDIKADKTYVDTELGTKLATSVFNTEIVKKEDKLISEVINTADTPKVESVPMFTLNNEGDYVLCTPDIWLFNGIYYIPGYLPSTVKTVE